MRKLYGGSFASFVPSAWNAEEWVSEKSVDYFRLLFSYAEVPILPPLSILQNENRVFEVKGYGLERTQNIQPDHAVRFPELEVTDHNVPSE
jgi:hypothetical protein